MYVRFVCRRPHPTVDGELGMFVAREDFDFSAVRPSLRKEEEEIFWWFTSRYAGGGLTRPRFVGKARTRQVRKSVFWFKADAMFSRGGGRVVERARRLAALLMEAGLEVRELRIVDPGRIIWEDHQQVLAYTEKGRVPKAFE